VILQELSAREMDLLTALAQLKRELVDVQDRAQKRDAEGFLVVRDAFRALFERLVPSKRAALVSTGRNIAEGITFEVKVGNGAEKVGVSSLSGVMGRRRCTYGSGGQKALLGLSFMFALSKMNPPPLLLLVRLKREPLIVTGRN
jgi:chromosome segregation ATPase